MVSAATRLEEKLTKLMSARAPPHFIQSESITELLYNFLYQMLTRFLPHSLVISTLPALASVLQEHSPKSAKQIRGQLRTVDSSNGNRVSRHPDDQVRKFARDSQ